MLRNFFAFFKRRSGRSSFLDLSVLDERPAAFAPAGADRSGDPIGVRSDLALYAVSSCAGLAGDQAVADGGGEAHEPERFWSEGVDYGPVEHVAPGGARVILHQCMPRGYALKLALEMHGRVEAHYWLQARPRAVYVEAR